MTRLTMYLAATAALAGLAAPAAAQTAYPYPYPQQQYPQTYPQAYPQSGYAYPGQPGYGSSPIGQVINQLLGNRYNVSDRTAVERCASAAMVQASNQYGGRYNNNRYGQGYPQQYGYGQGYSQQYGYNSQMRVTAITEVRRRNNGLRVSGLLASGYGAYGNQAYADPRYGTRADLSFRCDVDYRGAVTNVRIRRA